MKYLIRHYINEWGYISYYVKDGYYSSNIDEAKI